MIEYMEFWFAKAAADFVIGAAVLVVILLVMTLSFLWSERKNRRSRQKSK